MPRYFTPVEVQALIPSLELLVGQLVAARAEARILSARNGPPELLQVVQGRMQKLVNELGALGGQVKDLERGLLDFPCRRGSETVLLCWQLGEKRLGWYHSEDEGFSGRRPLEQPIPAPQELLN